MQGLLAFEKEMLIGRHRCGMSDSMPCIWLLPEKSACVSVCLLPAACTHQVVICRFLNRPDFSPSFVSSEMLLRRSAGAPSAINEQRKRPGVLNNLAGSFTSSRARPASDGAPSGPISMTPVLSTAAQVCHASHLIQTPIRSYTSFSAHVHNPCRLNCSPALLCISHCPVRAP